MFALKHKSYQIYSQDSTLVCGNVVIYVMVADQDVLYICTQTLELPPTEEGSLSLSIEFLVKYFKVFIVEFLSRIKQTDINSKCVQSEVM